MNTLAKLAAVVQRPAYWGALARGVAAGVEHEAVFLGRQMTSVIDVGAHSGQFALVARRMFPAAHIVSFEPLPAPARRFRAVLGSDPRVVLHEVAAGSESGEASMHVAGRDDSSSLLPISDLQEALFPGTAERAVEGVRVVRLAEALRKEDIVAPALLKIDVQGSELAVLEGAGGLLSTFALVYVECSFLELYTGQPLADEIIAWLRIRGFRLIGVHNLVCDRRGRCAQGDFLFAAASEGSTV